MALLILALLQRIFLMSSLMLFLVWLIFFMVLIKLLPILGTISGNTVKLRVLTLTFLRHNRQESHPPSWTFSRPPPSQALSGLLPAPLPRAELRRPSWGAARRADRPSRL